MTANEKGLTVGSSVSQLSSAVGSALFHRVTALAHKYPAAFVVALVLCRAILDGFGYQHPDDPTLLSTAGLSLLKGDLSAVYFDARVQVGPLGLVIYGLAGLFHEAGVGLIMASTLVTGVTFALALWVCVGILAPGPSERWRAHLAVGVAVIAGLSWTAATSGHPTEGLVALLWILCAHSAQNDRPVRAGVALGVAVSIKLYAVLGLPLLLLAPALRRSFAGSAIAALIAILLWGPFVLLGSFNMLDFTWEIRPQSPLALIFQEGSEFTWQLRMFQAGAVCVVGSLAALSLRRHSLAFLALPLVLMGLRFATDPLDYHYYLLGPGTVGLVAWALLVDRWRPVWWLAVPAFYFVALVPFFYWNNTLLALWILALAALFVFLPLGWVWASGRQDVRVS